MKLSHLRYIIEVAKTGSITRAAQNLYIGQPNLSKAIKDMETDLGFTVFTRSSKGAAPTKRGAEFIRRAEELLENADCFEEDFFGANIRSERLSVAVCGVERCIRAIDSAVTGLSELPGFKLECFRCDREKAIELAESGEVSFAAVREYSAEAEFEAWLSQKGLKGQKLCSGKGQILTAGIDIAAKKEIIEKSDLIGYTEVFVYGTNGIPINGQGSTAAVSDFESACRVLAAAKGSFMMISDTDSSIVSGELCIRELAGAGTVTDWVVFKEGKRFSASEAEVLGKLTETF